MRPTNPKAVTDETCPHSLGRSRVSLRINRRTERELEYLILPNTVKTILDTFRKLICKAAVIHL